MVDQARRNMILNMNKVQLEFTRSMARDKLYFARQRNFSEYQQEQEQVIDLCNSLLNGIENRAVVHA